MSRQKALPPGQQPTAPQPGSDRNVTESRPALAGGLSGVPDRPTPLGLEVPLSPVDHGGDRRRLVVHRVDPWSVFVFSFVFSVLLAVAIMVATVLLEVLLSRLGVLRAVNDLINEVRASPAGTGERAQVLSTQRILGGAAVLAAVDIVLVTAVSTVLALLYNVCVSLTGGIEVTVGEAAAS